MANINGDWFHSRSSSNIDELLSVRTLLFESQKQRYIGLPWSGGRYNNQDLYAFSSAANIQPSTMQTKIRAMIRYGFIKDGNRCPLVWTKMGNLWNELYSVGNIQAAKKIYELTLTISLAIFAFDDSESQFSRNPADGVMPLKFLFNNLNLYGAISLQDLGYLVDGHTSRVGQNLSYWKRDLINCGLFEEVNGSLRYTGKYTELVEEIKNFEPNPLLSENDWIFIRDNPLIEISPFKNAITNIYEGISSINDFLNGDFELLSTEPIIEAISEQEEENIPEMDILSDSVRYTNGSRRVRNAIWANRIKIKYNYYCAIPNCDVIGRLFVEAAHIKPDSAENYGIPHRAHILNGLCLCKHCHIAFDKGLISLTDEHEVIVSAVFERIPDQNLKRSILSSEGVKIKDRIDGRLPLVEFIQFHRANIFRD